MSEERKHDDDCFLSGGDDGAWPCICRTTTPQHPEPIEADRKMAADLEAWERDDSKRERFMSGEFDDTFAVQAFMHHRVAFSTPAASDPD